MTEMTDQYVTTTQLKDAVAPIHTDLTDVKTRLNAVEAGLAEVKTGLAVLGAHFEGLVKQADRTNDLMVAFVSANAKSARVVLAGILSLVGIALVAVAKFLFFS